MAQLTPLRTTEASSIRDLVEAARRRLLSRRGLLVLSGVLIVASLALGWNWLVAVGLAPLLLSALPCVAMCALGLCMQGMGGRSCSAKADPVPGIDARDDNPEASGPGKMTKQRGG